MGHFAVLQWHAGRSGQLLTVSSNTKVELTETIILS